MATKKLTYSPELYKERWLVNIDFGKKITFNLTAFKDLQAETFTFLVYFSFLF